MYHLVATITGDIFPLAIYPCYLKACCSMFDIQLDLYRLFAYVVANNVSRNLMLLKKLNSCFTNVM